MDADRQAERVAEKDARDRVENDARARVAAAIFKKWREEAQARPQKLDWETFFMLRDSQKPYSHTQAVRG